MRQKILNIFLLFSILILFSGFVFLYYQFNNLSQGIDSKQDDVDTSLIDKTVEPTIYQPAISGKYLTEIEVDNKISSALSTISGQATTVIKEVTPTAKKNITYISLGGDYSTVSTTWVDVPGAAVYVDVENDYGSNVNVSWEASLKVAHPNGQIFARLFDNTNKIAVDYSEISSDDYSNYEQVSSGYLPFWKGMNLYKVQIKSLNSFEVFYTGGKIKLAY